MKKLLYFFAILICLTYLLFISSCSKPGHEKTPIKIGINLWTGFAPFILAKKNDLFKKNNVNVKVIKYPSAPVEMQAIKTGEIHGATFTLDEVFSLIESGFNGKVVLITDYSMGGDMIIGQKDIKNMSELQGKTIGYEGTVIGEFLLDQALHKYYIKSDQVKLVNIQANNWFTAFKEKKIDALVCFNPIGTILLTKQEGNLLFSSAEIPFEIIDVLIFSESFYEDNKPAITNIVKSWFDALTYIKTNTDTAADIISSAKNISPEEYKQSLKGLVAPDLKENKSVFDPQSAKNIYKYSQVVVDFMIYRGLLSKRVNTTDLFTPEILSNIDNN